MPVIRTMGRTLGRAVRGTRAIARGSTRGGRWLERHIHTIRDRGAAGEAGMMRLLDLHAASCAGDTLVTIGLAGTIFFSVPAGEARGRVALYLLITMVPFALLAPVVGPLLDRFRHGRRYALAVTMLGRAFLAWLISDYLHGFGLYPAAFGVLALSRSYGVARSAAVPRLLPARLGLSEAGARASMYGAAAGAVVAPLGLLAYQIGPQWPLRLATLIFCAGAVYALRLPPRADSDTPETLPHLGRLRFGALGGNDRVLRGPVIVSVLTGAGALRLLYGFLLLYLAFAIKADDLLTTMAGSDVSQGAALSLIGTALGAGTLLATAIGTRLRIRRPVVLQASALISVAALAVLATIRPTLATAVLLCLGAAIGSGLAKLAVDATIQEQVDDSVRASAFAHSETLLMLAWVAGGAIGLVPFHPAIGLGLAAVVAMIAAVRGVVVAVILRRDRLRDATTDRQRAELADPLPETAVDLADTALDLAETALDLPDTATDPLAGVDSDDALTSPGFHLYRPSQLDTNTPMRPDGVHG